MKQQFKFVFTENSFNEFGPKTTVTEFNRFSEAKQLAYRKSMGIWSELAHLEDKDVDVLFEHSIKITREKV
jgi:hypothetical protein